MCHPSCHLRLSPGDRSCGDHGEGDLRSVGGHEGECDTREALEQPRRILFHFTSIERWLAIAAAEVPLPVESNLSPVRPRSGPDVVWLTSSPEVTSDSHGLRGSRHDKSLVRMRVHTQAERWRDFAVRHGGSSSAAGTMRRGGQRSVTPMAVILDPATRPVDPRATGQGQWTAGVSPRPSLRAHRGRRAACLRNVRSESTRRTRLRPQRSG